MENVLTKKRIITGLVLAVVAVGLYFLISFLYGYFFFIAKSSSPKNGSTVPNSTQQAVITFSKDLQPDQDVYKDIQISPKRRIYSNVVIDKNKLVINYVALDIDTEYAVTFKEIKSVDGKVIKNFKYAIKTKYVDYGKLSGSQQKEAMKNVDVGNASDPVMAYIPHSTLNYTIDPVFKTKDDGSAYLTLGVTIMLTGSDQGNEAAATEQYKNQALEYLRSKGVKTENYTITYTINSSIF